ncbi:MAG: hypothetical protein FJX71_03280 [Alphaproteobacteria bacterium]|nr:hypothetical protein [Alphaproteobacteria bacterium]
MIKTLVLYSSYTNQISYFDDWVDAFKEHSSYESECINVYDARIDLSQIHHLIENTDLIVLHHSMNGDTLEYLKPFISPLKNRKGKLVSFVGNEINLPTIGMVPKIKILQELQTDVIATQLLQEAGEWLYSDCKDSKIISIPHALNPKAFYPIKNFGSRGIDIGTRSARYGVYLGDNDRNAIIHFFHENAKKFELSVDLGLDNSSQKRFTRPEWASFLNSCKATLSSEAGSFYLEKDDRLVNQIQKYLKKSSERFVLPNETIARKIYRQILPSFVRKKIAHALKNHIVEVGNLDEDSNFEEIYKKFFSKEQKCPAYSKAISSRHFDAIGTRTLHIMYPGRYNDILKAGEHYFALKNDHSNVEELIETLKNSELVNKTTGSTFDYVMSHHTHKHRLDTLLNVLG